MRNPFKYLKASPEIIRLVVMMFVRSPPPAPNGVGARLDFGSHADLRDQSASA
jgi:hypothetical protein